MKIRFNGIVLRPAQVAAMWTFSSPRLRQIQHKETRRWARCMAYGILTARKRMGV